MKYTVQNLWGTGAGGRIDIHPECRGHEPDVDFDVADQRLVTNTYSASFVQIGSHVRLTNASFDGSVAAGGTSATVGVMIYTNPTLTNLPGLDFSVNGQPCSSTVSRYVVPVTFRAVVPEGGSLGIPVRLSEAPTANIVLTTYNPTGFTATPSSLTFTPVNWNTPQVVTVTALEDADTTNQGATLPIQQQN